jgi:hypothetical protein
MNLFVKALQFWTPGFIRWRALEALFAGTAEAFGRAVPPPSGRSFEGRLREYARFTQQAADDWLARGQDGPALQGRLFAQGERLGRRLRRMLRLRTTADVLAAGQWLYGVIGVEFHGRAHGDCIVRQCFFSDYYSCQSCRLMSAMDDGVFAGLSGGGRLTFSQRITEGYDCCRATFVPRPEES